MLLPMIRTSRRIYSTVNRRAGNSPLDDMDDVPTGFIFQTIDERQTVNTSKIVWLAAGSRVKSRLVENDTQPVADGPGLYDVRVELKQVRIVVIKPLGFHAGLIHACR